MTPCLQTTGGVPTGGSSSRADDTSVKRATNPRIHAEGESMSNAPGSPKVFEGSVVRTTENGVHFKVDFKGTDSRQAMGYFLFQLRGLKGREKVRIDFVNVGRWPNSRSIVPLYARGIEELSDLTALRARPPEDSRLEREIAWLNVFDRFGAEDLS